MCVCVCVEDTLWVVYVTYVGRGYIVGGVCDVCVEDTLWVVYVTCVGRGYIVGGVCDMCG